MEMERAEFDAVMESLVRSPRLANLLRYVGERYFSGQSEELTEYNIATEVFGRSRTTFDASEDAIARVEAHRLRKRLKEYYEGEGREHSIQLTIPAGTYVPSFVRRLTPEESPVQADARPLSTATGGAQGSGAESFRGLILGWVAGLKRLPNWFWPVLALLLLSVAAALLHLLQRTGSQVATAPIAQRVPQQPAFTPSAGWAPASVPLRILAGYSGEPQTDNAGAVWLSDRYVHGGGPWNRPDSPIAKTSDPLLFQQWRSGDFVYDIPLRPGAYELHLYFVSSERSSDDYSTFNLRINGNLVLSGFDINSDALGENVADERIFRDVSPGSDGYLHLAFTSERGTPMLNALEILPGTTGRQLPIRLLMQRTSFTDSQGRFWHPDDYFFNGRLSDQRTQITGTSDPDLFSAERFGHFTYTLPVDTRDRYTLVLHFVEFYFGKGMPGGGGAGNRVFRVLCNGQTLLDNFDIYKEAGSLHVLTKTFPHIRPSAQGKLNLTFEPIVNNATISGIEVLDEGQ